jgi:hypothetical protein
MKNKNVFKGNKATLNHKIEAKSCVSIEKYVRIKKKIV